MGQSWGKQKFSGDSTFSINAMLLF
uniref:Uncharacterized protein n=1 Tax=Arundo donax TaxID=35708 RepID=A0A0A9C1C6_ARUDO